MGVLTFFAFFIVTFVTVGYLFVKKRYSYWANRGVPCEKPTFPYGNFGGVTKTRHLSDVFKQCYDQFKGKASYAGIYLGISPCAVILDLDLIKHILIKDFNYFVDRGFYYNEKDDPLTAHLFLLEGEKWRNLRIKLSPTFTSGKMKYMFPTIVDVGDHLKDVLTDMIKCDQEIEVKDVVARFTTDVIGTCAFGIECNSLKDPNVEFREIGKKAFSLRRNSQIVDLLINTFPDLSRKLGLKVIPEEITQFYMRIVRETVDYREKNDIVRNDFMHLLLQLKNHGKVEGENVGTLTFNEIVAQAFLFFFAGFETSSTVMSFCLYQLAMNPEIQEKLRNEIFQVLKKYDGKITYEAVKEMTYLDMTINETMRMYPPAGHLIRKAIKDYNAPNTNQIIEKGTNIFIPVYAIQNDPEIYEEPEKFDPERFSAENVKKRHPFSFLPFGDGPRNCIGLRFGKMQANIGMVELLTTFRFSKCAKTEVPLKLNVKSPLIGVEKMYLKVEKL